MVSCACSNPQCPSRPNPELAHVVKNGFFRRTSDRRRLQCYLCRCCGSRFSEATGSSAFGQKKRQLNRPLALMLGSGVTMRRAGILLRTTRKTVARKLHYLGDLLNDKNQLLIAERAPIAAVQFDEMETFEHTKCKPVAIALAVEKDTRLILGAEVSTMPAKGKLANIAVKKYGRRHNGRRYGLKLLFEGIASLLAPEVVLESDECPLYKGMVGQTLGANPDIKITYNQHKGARGCITGQGELKKLVRDPLFSLNHTAAMLRANISRLFRRTWNTTKKLSCLLDHIRIYAYFHNAVLLRKGKKPPIPSRG
jgi:transposase-like protein